jgi:hypothetical protein
MEEHKELSEAIRGLADVARATLLQIRGDHLALVRVWDALVKTHPELRDVLRETEAWKETATSPEVDRLIGNIDAIVQQLKARE